MAEITIIPIIAGGDKPIPILFVDQSQGAIANQGITYNQASYTFNQIGIQYGGFYGNSDMRPIIASERSPSPSFIVSK